MFENVIYVKKNIRNVIQNITHLTNLLRVMSTSGCILYFFFSIKLVKVAFII